MDILSKIQIKGIVNKWFKFRYVYGEEPSVSYSDSLKVKSIAELASIRYAVSLKEAWEKTFTKWYLIAQLKFDHPIDVQCNAANCGLCNLFIDNHCDGCPIEQYTKSASCLNTPLDTPGRPILDEILFLYHVYITSLGGNKNGKV